MALLCLLCTFPFLPYNFFPSFFSHCLTDNIIAWKHYSCMRCLTGATSISKKEKWTLFSSVTYGSVTSITLYNRTTVAAATTEVISVAAVQSPTDTNTNINWYQQQQIFPLLPPPPPPPSPTAKTTAVAVINLDCS